MNFMFEWQEQYFTTERSERVRTSMNIKFVSSSQSEMFFLLYGDFILNNKRDARNQFNKSKRRES